MNKRRFTVQENEGSFFAEFWLVDSVLNTEFKDPDIPVAVMAAFIKECKERGKFNPIEARIIVDFALRAAEKQATTEQGITRRAPRNGNGTRK